MAVRITWDCSIANRPTAATYGVKLYKVSNRVFSKAELEGGVMTFTNGNTYAFDINRSDFTYGGDSTYRCCYQRTGSADFVTGYDGSYTLGNQFCNISEDGTYFAAYNGEGYITELYLPNASGDPMIYYPDGYTLSIRCPDSVMQGSFIIIACDTEEVSYVDFTCTLSGHTSPRTKLMPNTDKTLRLWCGSDETASELLIEVASKAYPSVTVSKTITVVPNNGSGVPPTPDYTGSTITDIALFIYPETVRPGGCATVEAILNGTGNYNQLMHAEISGYTSPLTHLATDGYKCNVWIGREETAEYVTVDVKSVQDPTVTATGRIYIDYSGTEDNPSATEEQLQLAFWQGYAAARALLGGGK